MGPVSQAGRVAAGHYGRAFNRVRHPVRSLETEAQHLHEVEEAGESGTTPFIAILGLVFFLGSIFAVMLGLALIAYYVIA